MKEAMLIGINHGAYASQWGLTDFYPESLRKLETALASGEDFKTDWFGCKKEIRYARYTRADGHFIVEVSAETDDLFDSEDLIYDALWSACKLDIELPEDIIDSIRDEAIDENLGDGTYLVDILPEDATLEQIIDKTQELEGRCEMSNEAMFDTLCNIVKDHVEFYNLKEED